MDLLTRAPNRTLDLEELDTPEFRSVLRDLDRLLERDSVTYLHPSKRWEYPWALERAELTAGSRVLDIGCGDSISPIYLATLGHRVAAADLQVTPGLARPHGVDVGYLAADLTAIPIDDASLDAVFCISVIEHLPAGRIPLAMREMHRVLVPGGRLLLTTDYYEDAAAALWYEGPGEPFRVDWGFFDEERLRRLILEVPGFTLDGPLDLTVDWERNRPRMLEFHGYPYTSVGVALTRSPDAARSEGESR